MPKNIDVPCKNGKCFACLRGKCYALDHPEFNLNGECQFFKTIDQVDRETMRRIYPRPEKNPIEYTDITGKKEFEKWFATEWNEATLYLLANHRKKISKMPIVLEL